jgi:septal ring factor EnvC (AmiA/AmiB activator)
MQKKSKIAIASGMLLSLLLVATHLSSSGGLQSSAIASTPLERSCQSGKITSLEKCGFLVTQQTQVEKEMSVVSKKILAKKTECANLSKMKESKEKKTRLATCNKEVATLESTLKTQNNDLSKLKTLITKLVSEKPLQAAMAKAQKEVDALQP